MIPKKKCKSVFLYPTDDGDCISFNNLVQIFPELKDAYTKYLENRKFDEYRLNWIDAEMIRIHIAEGGYECPMSGIHDYCWDTDKGKVERYNRIRKMAEDNFINL